MNDVYMDILEGFKEIGELEGNEELVDAAQIKIDEAIDSSNKRSSTLSIASSSKTIVKHPKHI